LGFLTINALRASNEVIIPVETSRFSIQGVYHLLDIVNLIRDRLNHPVDYKILVTMFDSRLRHSFSMMSTIRERFSDHLFDTTVHINVKLKESAVSGQTVMAFDKYCRGAKDYFTLAKEIIAVDAPAAALKAAAAQVIAKPLAPKAEMPKAEMSGRMRSLVKEEVGGLFKTDFNLKAPEARSVYVTGSFNDWSLDESCRMRLENDQWVASVALKPGVYKYQFIVDGRWKEDPSNPMQERNSFGDINSLLEVKANV